MDFDYTPEQTAFRTEFRSWLEANLPPELCVDDAIDSRIAPTREIFEKRRVWQKKMHEAGWVGISWPREYGGRGATLLEQIVYDEELGRARAPVLPGHNALGLLGPTLMHWGTEQQKQRYLANIMSGDEIWCEGFSEPNAGSDLASVQTRAEDQGDYFMVNGSKIWTSGAHYADQIYMLTRSDPLAPKHRGISFLMVDMKSPGVTIRPLILMNGHRQFNQVFFENVQVPKENLVGKLNEGWQVAITTLNHERGGGGGVGHRPQVERLAELAQSVMIGGRPAWELGWVRQKLAQFMIDCEAIRYTSMRSLTRQLKGLPRGPEGSMLKLFATELGVRIAQFATELLGCNALLGEPSEVVPDAPRWQNRVLSSRQYTIAGGTSQIQYNIIGERTLGLPKSG